MLLYSLSKFGGEVDRFDSVLLAFRCFMFCQKERVGFECIGPMAVAALKVEYYPSLIVNQNGVDDAETIILLALAWLMDEAEVVGSLVTRLELLTAVAVVD